MKKSTERGWLRAEKEKGRAISDPASLFDSSTDA